MKLRERVILYLTRPAVGGTEVLVFACDHGGWQTIAGGVEAGESAHDAARREAKEEAGVDLAGPIRRLNATMFRYSGYDTWCVQHFLTAEAPAGLPETWKHRVTGDGVECGRLHELGWLPATRLDWLVAGQGNAAPFLQASPPTPPRAEVMLRPATNADLPFLKDLRNGYVATSAAIYVDDPWTDDDAAAWLSGRDVGLHPIVVADVDGVAAGFGSLSPFDTKSGYRHTVENTIYVAADQHGRGVGTALLADLLKRAGDAGHRSVIARIDARQPASLALHLRHGFIPSGVLREAGRKFGAWHDVVYLQRLLNEAAT